MYTEYVGLVKCSILLTNVNHNCNALNMTQCTWIQSEIHDR